MRRGPLVLVVDDDPDTLEMLVEYLSVNGCRVLEAADGAEALRIASSERPAVVLLDLMMPHLSGLEVARRLRSDAPDGARAVLPSARLIATTGCTTEADHQLALESGFDRVIAKPYDLESLLAIVRAR